MQVWENIDSLEVFLRRQEKLIKQDEIYKRLIIIPIIVIAVSVSVLAYNFTAGRQTRTAEMQELDFSEVQTEENSKIIPEEKINLNTATADMLDALPGIGPQKAGAIIEIRDKMGGFRSVEDILNVDGIGEKIFKQIKESIYVETKK